MWEYKPIRDSCIGTYIHIGRRGDREEREIGGENAMLAKQYWPERRDSTIALSPLLKQHIGCGYFGDACAGKLRSPFGIPFEEKVG